MAQVTQARMPMHNLDLLSNDNIPEHWEEGEDSWKGGGAVDNEEWHVVDLESIREVSNASSPIICMRDDYDFVSSIDELRGELVDMTFDTTELRKEEIADHCDIVGHFRGILGSCYWPAGQHNTVGFRAENALLS